MIRARQIDSGVAKGLWALLWRMVLLTPVALLGLVALVIVFGLYFLAPLFVVALLFTGRYFLAAIVLAVWILWLRFGAPVRRFVFEGFAYGSL